MAEMDFLRDLAKKTLTVPIPSTKLDHYFWGRAQRLVRNVEYICQLPEIINANLPIDRFCLIAATYFNDAGLADQFKKEKNGTKFSVNGGNDDELMDICAQVVEEKLQPHLDQARIKKIIRIIAESNSHLTRMTEAMILSDARNLDDMGTTGIVNELRRYIIEGKCVSDLLQIWKRKIDYGYWQARLKESFRFQAVRKVAEQRLSTAKYFMNQLEAEIKAEDLEELSIHSTFV